MRMTERFIDARHSTEGKVVAAGVKNAVEGVQDAVEKVQGTSAAVMKSAAVFDAGRVNVEEAAE